MKLKQSLKAVNHIVASSAETIGAFNTTGFNSVNLHRPTSSSGVGAAAGAVADSSTADTAGGPMAAREACLALEAEECMVLAFALMQRRKLKLKSKFESGSSNFSFKR